MYFDTSYIAKFYFNEPESPQVRALVRELAPMARMPESAKTDPLHEAPRPDSVSHSRLEPAALARLLDEWMQGDEVEQRETFEILRHSLDEPRPAGYKLFT